ncbi:THAP domain-containing protein 9 [Plakobranchus ocellatus]|uniref:THAP domain-containing protein 9 n=1 Tax=Plakobranchus ocellatus TaxID=259542 RepID=A0AAV4ABI4_9GAST|nr:THAP domain-containing protein 9 [Plakobranchus ocellatus]
MSYGSGNETKQFWQVYGLCESEMATEALFFMVVGVKGRWKVRFEYFLDDVHLANKISRKHIDYVKSKMDVRLAAQTLSNSVPDAIDFPARMKVTLISKEVQQQRKDFIRKIDTLFDLCKSKTPFAKEPMSRIDQFNLCQNIQKFDKFVTTKKN